MESQTRGRRYRVIAVGATAVAVAGLIGAGPAPASAAPQALEWTVCPPVHGAGPDVRCTTVDVPLDYSKPNGPTIEITVSKISARDESRRRGVVMGNPGGPGGDAIPMFTQLRPPAGMLDEWDLVAVQPRGLPSATPLRCAPLTGAEPEIYTAAGKLDRNRCERRTPGVGRTLTTENTARDMEVVRRALGEQKVSLYGVSYGTLLMSTYATLFPERVDRMVLDSGFDPALVWNGLLPAQTGGYKARVHDMMAWIAKNDSTYHLGTTPLAVYQKWSAQVSRGAGVPPSLVAPPAQIGDVPPGLAFMASQYIAGANLTAEARAKFENFIATLVNPGKVQASSTLLALTRTFAPDRNGWPIIATLIADPDVKMPTPPREALVAAQISQDMQAIILCNENQAPAQPARGIESFVTNFVTGDIFDGPGLFYESGMACAGTAPVTRPVQVRNKGLAVQPLQIQSVDDPQTPYRGSLTMRRQMGSHLLTVGGGDHAQLGRANVPVEAAIVEYLRTGRTGVTRAGEAPISTSLTDPFGRSAVSPTS